MQVFIVFALTVMALVILLLIFIWIQSLKGAMPEFIHSQWAYYFPDLQFSSKEYYHSVEQILETRKIPETINRRIIFSEAVFSNRNREYLRVKNGPYSFDICAAPYGTGFFVSWWFGEDMGCLMRILSLIPLVGWYLRTKALNKTYYVMDCEAMFQEAVRNAVNEAIGAITKDKGLRALSYDELKPTPRMRRR